MNKYYWIGLILCAIAGGLSVHLSHSLWGVVPVLIAEIGMVLIAKKGSYDQY